MKHPKFLRLVGAVALVTLVAGLMPAAGPALAVDPPGITVTPTWRPPAQLTSLDAGAGADAYPNYNPGDDYRYVELELFATASVEYSAVEVECKYDSSLLEGFHWDDGSVNPPTDDPGDDWPMVEMGPAWGGLGGYGGEYTMVPAPVHLANAAQGGSAPNSGTISFAAAAFGGRRYGRWGQSQTDLVARIRFRVRPQNPATFSSKPMKITCKTRFLDYNGKDVARPKYQRPNDLVVMSGYSITGNVTYQALKRHDGIGVNCVYDPGGVGDEYKTRTDRKGNFAINGLRDKGYYHCNFFGNVTTAEVGDPVYDPDLHLQAWTDIHLLGQSYQFQPVVLSSGNLDRVAGIPQRIDEDDLALVTGNWNVQSTAGDANGNGLTNEEDLAIVAANWYRGEDEDARHMLISMPRQHDLMQDSRVWLTPLHGELLLGELSRSKSNPIYWATLSPDGSKLAYIKAEGSKTPAPWDVNTAYVLYVANADGSGAKPITPRNWRYDALAPSWSPDGSKLAFMCGEKNTGSDQWGTWIWREWANNTNSKGEFTSHFCVIDSNGANLGISDLVVSVFPPAWLDNDTFMFAVDVGDPEGYSLGISWIAGVDAGWWSWFDEAQTRIPFGADMPRVSGYDENGTGHQLFYRYTDPGTGQHTLRYAEIEWGPGGPTVPPFFGGAHGGATAPYHMNVEYDVDGGDPGTVYALLSTDVDFYHVSSFGHIVFYESRCPWDWNGGNCFRNGHLNNSGIPEWHPDPYDFGSSQWMYWGISEGHGNPEAWDGNWDHMPNWRAGLRNTVEWIQ